MHYSYVIVKTEMKVKVSVSTLAKDIYIRTIYVVIENDVYHFSYIGSVLVCGDLNSRTGENEDNIKPCNINRFVQSAPGDF